MYGEDYKVTRLLQPGGMSLSKQSAAAVDDIFVQCCQGTSRDGEADFRSLAAVFWPVLDNKLSLVDFAGVFTMSCPSSSASSLDSHLFSDFFGGVARMKYPTGGDFVERLLDNVKAARSIKIRHDLPLFAKAMDKHVIRELLKFDIPLRRAFSSFAGQSITIGGGLTWDEVRKHSLGMEVGGFVAFAGAYSLIPSVLTLQRCEMLARDVLSRFPLLGTSSSLHTALLYPQFQLLLCSVAIERFDSLNNKDLKTGGGKFAKKVTPSSSESNKSLAEIFVDLIRAIGIDKSLDGSSANEMRLSPTKSDGKILSIASSPEQASAIVATTNPASPYMAAQSFGKASGGHAIGVVTMPTSTRPEDAYSSSMNHSRHAQLLRMEHLFEEIETKMLTHLGSGSEIVALLASTSLEERLESRSRLSSKPVVIGDAVPVPSVCPEPVEQLLQAALAHHNLGNFEESLKFMEAARMQLEDFVRRVVLQKRREEALKLGEDVGHPPVTDTAPAEIPFDLELYVTLCKGNVYQSCGDDEQSLLHYLDGWERASSKGEKDWEIVCLNSIGMLAYYSLRYDVALLCFAAVAAYRTQAYGLTSADTATAWNNEGCCLFCLQLKGEARLRFEKSWAVMCKVLGHRAPRSVAIWKNLEKARRAGALGKGKTTSELATMRPDAGRLILGGSFQIKAIGPPEEGKKKKGGKKSGKKKKG